MKAACQRPYAQLLLVCGVSAWRATWQPAASPALGRAGFVTQSDCKSNPTGAKNTRQTALPTNKLTRWRDWHRKDRSRRVDARATADRRGHGRAKAGPFADAPLRMDAMARAAVRRATSRRKSIVSGCENLAAKFLVIAGYD